jgi:hypothetical protein
MPVVPIAQACVSVADPNEQCVIHGEVGAARGGGGGGGVGEDEEVDADADADADDDDKVDDEAATVRLCRGGDLLVALACWVAGSLLTRPSVLISTVARRVPCTPRASWFTAISAAFFRMDNESEVSALTLAPVRNKK